MNNSAALEKMVKFRVRDLDAMPLVFRKLLAILNSPYPSPRELGQVIETDQSLSVRVLRMVNSAAGGQNSPVLSVPQAVSLLGINVVRSLSFCMASYDAFFSPSDQGRKELWRHSVLTGILGRILSSKLHVGQPEEMFVAGMLHDVGRSVLMKHYPQKVRLLEALTAQLGNPLEAEQKTFGVTHAEAGGWTCECWKLPDVLTACVRHHHAPGEAGEFAAQARLIHVADAWALRALSPENPELQLFQDGTLEALHLTPESAQEGCDEALLHLRKIESFLV
ncbi:HDOD domain-containing protein [bacterium]|nr:HDOD domain-containing protein [bacterium]